MKAKKSGPVSHGGLALIEEAIVLLRTSPAGLLALFYVGALPFVLALLYFWADMSRGAFADRRLAGTSLIVGFLYLWMKCWHTVFGRQLLAHIGEETPVPWDLRRICRMIVVQTIIQPWALFIRPIALLITMPYGWVRAFFENATILGDGTVSSTREVSRRALEQAKLWPLAHLQSLGLLFLFGVFVFVNTALLIITVPFLLKTFLGIETTFTSSSFSVFNSTFFAAALAGAWLCVNPLTKAIHVLRCFHGAALHTGADLRVDLRKIRRAMLLALCLLFALPSGNLRAAPAVEPQTIDRSIEEVLQRREFIWREPRQLSPEEEKGWLESFFKDVENHLKEWLKPIKKWAKEIARWIEDWLRNRQENERPEDGGFDWGQPAKWLLICLIIALVVALILLWRRFRRQEPVLAQAESLTAIPDLAAEDVTAEQLPEDGWLTLAREMIAKGELRLALRAFYLASLTLLGSRQWIALARHKSNHDYERELQRRGRGSPAVLENFSATLDAFERAWYGSHAVTPETIAEVQARLERMRSC